MGPNKNGGGGYRIGGISIRDSLFLFCAKIGILVVVHKEVNYEVIKCDLLNF